MENHSTIRLNRLIRRNLRLARAKWSSLSLAVERALRLYSEQLRMSVERGDLLLIDRKWYVTHSGLLRIATRRRCCGIAVTAMRRLCDPSSSRWTFKATVYKSPTCKGFVGHGDADPSNVSGLVRGAEMRVAETRAVNRALRKAYGIGLCSVEELGSFSDPLPPARPIRNSMEKAEPSSGHHPLRDRLCLLIRQHKLEPTLVKAYAADYCDVSELRLASRQQIATFIKHLAEYAQIDRAGLLCQLNSYTRKPVCPAPVAPVIGPDAQPEKVDGAA
jgi:hypothetical protein